MPTTEELFTGTSGTAATGSGSTSGAQWFPDPFLDYSGLYSPRNLNSMLRWCELMWAHNGTYRMALERVCAYFLTKIEVKDVADSVKSQYEEFLNDTLKVTSILRMVGLDFLFYGNSFTSQYVPFRRYLRCPACKFDRPIERVNYTYKNFKFFGTCEKCGHRGEYDMVDRRSTEQDKFQIIRWSPHNMHILFHPMSHRAKYMMRIPEDFRQHIQNGRPFYIQHTPKEILEAVQKKQLFAFDDDVVFHLKEETLAGMHNRGWGLPRAISNFKQGFYIQVLKRYNEALALDYIVPWRVIVPKLSGNEKIDPLLNANLGDFKSRVRGMIAEHRRDPLAMHTLPYPIEYNVLGGEANSLAPSDLLTLALDELLNACGVPAEMYKGTLQYKALPSAMRLFEATWPHLVAGFNNWLNWLLEGVSMTFNWERARAQMTPVTRADDMEARMIRLELAAAQKISDTTALAPFGIDVREEIKRMLDEQRYLKEEQQKAQKDEEQAAEMQRRLAEVSAARQGIPGMAGMPAGGVAPGMGAGGGLGAPGGGDMGKVTPSDLLQQAEQIAEQMLQMPEGERRRRLNQIKSQDETLHAIVKQKMTQMRSDARSVGQDQVLAQMGGQVM